MERQKPPYYAFVVDDNHDTAAMLALVLRDLGCEAAFTTDARNAVAEIARLKPHIVFLDIGMPHLDGYQLARLLRAEYQAELKLVAITGYIEAEDREACRQAGFDAHVVKPISVSLIESIIKTMLRPENEAA